MKKYDLSKKELKSIPHVSDEETENIELNLEENNINQIDYLPFNCSHLNLSKNK